MLVALFIRFSFLLLSLKLHILNTEFKLHSFNVDVKNIFIKIKIQTIKTDRNYFEKNDYFLKGFPIEFVS